jgi:hypothetical protein
MSRVHVRIGNVNCFLFVFAVFFDVVDDYEMTLIPMNDNKPIDRPEKVGRSIDIADIQDLQWFESNKHIPKI